MLKVSESIKQDIVELIIEQSFQPFRHLIADSTECMALAHQFDALVMVPNCDKNVPGLLMAAARLNLPTVFVSGGPICQRYGSEGQVDAPRLPLDGVRVFPLCA